MLLTRRQLMDRVEQPLRPLFRWQMVQVLIGIALIALGVQCWARNTDVPHRLVSGIILHVYGVIVIAQGLFVCTRIRRIDYSKPVADIRSKLDSVRSGYLRGGIITGFVWWLMWLPVTVALGFDAVVTYRNSFVPSMVIGVVGPDRLCLAVLARPEIGQPVCRIVEKKSSLVRASPPAYLALDEIENAQIR